MKIPHRTSLLNVFFIFLITSFQFCRNKDQDPLSPLPLDQAPLVLTTTATEITDISAVCGGSIQSEDSTGIQSWGLCRSTFSMAGLAAGIIEKPPFSGSFSLKMKGLEPGTKYFVRAFAIWNGDTIFGNEIEFSTADLCDVDGNTYKSIAIGSQVWMQENLKTRHYRNGDSIPYGLSNNTWEFWYQGACSEYNNDPAYGKVYGLVYNGYATADPRELCPAGWHLPDEKEWLVLINYLGGVGKAGGKMKSRGSRDKGDGLWLPPNVAATNNSGFSALPAGHRNPDGTYHQDGKTAYWWARSDTPGLDSDTCIDLTYYAEYSNLGKEKLENGFSIRCLKD